jgi:ASC-1-like (ASCH) protein
VTFFKDLHSSSSSKPDPRDKHILPEEDAVLEKAARMVVQWKMTVPAIVFLESVKPLNYIGSQAMVFFEPIVQAVFSIQDYDTFRSALEKRESIEVLLHKIEAHDAVAYRRDKLYKKKLREERRKWKWYQRYLGIKQPRIDIDPADLDSPDNRTNHNPSSTENH